MFGTQENLQQFVQMFVKWPKALFSFLISDLGHVHRLAYNVSIQMQPYSQFSTAIIKGDHFSSTIVANFVREPKPMS